MSEELGRWSFCRFGLFFKLPIVTLIIFTRFFFSGWVWGFLGCVWASSFTCFHSRAALLLLFLPFSPWVDRLILMNHVPGLGSFTSVNTSWCCRTDSIPDGSFLLTWISGRRTVFVCFLLFFCFLFFLINLIKWRYYKRGDVECWCTVLHGLK